MLTAARTSLCVVVLRECSAPDSPSPPLEVGGILKPQRVLELDEKLVRVEPPSIGELEHIMVVNHEQIGGDEWTKLVVQLLDRTTAQACSVVDAQIVKLDGATRHEAQRRIEVASDTLVGEGDVPEIVG
jgi:hypothetical protein